VCRHESRLTHPWHGRLGGTPGGAGTSLANRFSSVSQRLYQLFLLNICLQMFDGIATYEGVRLHWSEGNPLLLNLMPYLGLGTTLLLFKAKACGFLLVLRQLDARPLVCESMVVLAAVYTFFSFIPWMTRLLSLVTI
jgi:hypothetical protein